MEITCTRCHQTVHDGNCFCPTCGLPQLVYASDGAPAAAQSEPWTDAVRDAGSIDWKAAMRAALILGVPAGMLCSEPSPLSGFRLVWMGSAAAFAVVLYVRQQRPAWITAGAGARIGLVTGIMAGWLAFAISGGWLFAQRFLLRQGDQVEAFWKNHVELSQQLTAGFAAGDPAQAAAFHAQYGAWLLTPQGRAGMWAATLLMSSCFLVIFAMCGGALGARLMARSRRPEI
jgi:hypothetical protein